MSTILFPGVAPAARPDGQVGTGSLPDKRQSFTASGGLLYGKPLVRQPSVEYPLLTIDHFRQWSTCKNDLEWTGGGRTRKTAVGDNVNVSDKCRLGAGFGILDRFLQGSDGR